MKKLAASIGLVAAITVNEPCRAAVAAADDPEKPVVVLLHGLARSASSMDAMARALGEAGYRICNIDYPSRQHTIAELAAEFVAPEVERCVADASAPPNFVTHSMGGIIVRQLASTRALRSIGRVVMLGPPNHGSEVVDTLGDWALFDAINGPAGRQLGTSQDSLPQQLGPAGFELGVIAGRHSINWINSLMIPGPDDGKVSVESARLDGMRDFVIVPATHPLLMQDREVIEQTIRFLKTGCFASAEDGSRPAGIAACVAGLARE